MENNNSNMLFVKGTTDNNELVIISFAGNYLSIGGIPPFEYLNFLNKYFPEHDKYFFIDTNKLWYHKGISNLSTDIESTNDFINNILQKYKKSIFIGNSAGGYASILFGSLLNIDKVIAFIPQTNLMNQKNDNLNQKYLNLKEHINNKTKYFIYGDNKILDENNLHCVSHCKNLENIVNVQINYIENLDLRKLRDNGDLLNILNNIII